MPAPQFAASRTRLFRNDVVSLHRRASRRSRVRCNIIQFLLVYSIANRGRWHISEARPDDTLSSRGTLRFGAPQGMSTIAEASDDSTPATAAGRPGRLRLYFTDACVAIHRMRRIRPWRVGDSCRRDGRRAVGGVKVQGLWGREERYSTRQANWRKDKACWCLL